MNQHLTWEQISDYMIGDSQPGHSQKYAAHARECGFCRAEIARLEGALSEFRGAVRNWTERVSSLSAAKAETTNAGVETSIVHFEFKSSMYAGNETRAGLTSLAIHAGMIALLLFLGSLKTVQKAVKEVVVLIAPAPPLKVAENKGGGGGGARQPEQKKADLPKPRQFVQPPTATPVQTRLELPSSLLDVNPNLDPADIGAPTGLTALNGLGAGGGIGTGRGGGIGPGNGVGTGLGSNGGSGGGVYRPGNGVSNPVPIFRPEPQYSEEARKAKWQGSVLISLVVDENGKTTDIHVVRPLGLGLDEKAIEAVSKWLFKPGMKDGKAVKVQAQIEVTFRLL